MSEHEMLKEAIALARRWISEHSPRTGLAGFRLMPKDLQRLADAAESTLPRTKMVETWHCAWSTRSPGGDFVHVNAYLTEGGARDHAESLESGGNNSGVQMFGIKVTGPHQQEVPST